MSQESKLMLPNLPQMRALSIFLLSVGLVAGAWLLLPNLSALSFTGSNVDHSNIPAGVRRESGWVMGAMWLVVAAGSGALLAMVGGLLRWQRANAQSKVEPSKPDVIKMPPAEEANRLTLESRLIESKQAEECLQKANRELQDRFSKISRSHDSLQEELNKRKQAEKQFGEQRQELERTKDILEMHVQARTLALQKLQHRYESILNSAGEGICGLDLEGQITFANPAAAKISGWSIEELIGKDLQAAFSGLKENAALKDLAQTTLSERVLNRKNGSVFQAEYMQTPIHDSGRLIGAVVVFKDITERKTAQEELTNKAAELTHKAAELTRSNAELEQFAFVASHDLQEPLRKIQAFGDRLKAKCRNLELGEGWDYLERMHNAATRMQRLINDLLTFSRSIKSDQPFVPVDLNEATREVLTDLEIRVEQTQAVVEVGSLPTIDADPTQMRQLLQNLIGNALKFQPPNSKPSVKITANTLGERPAVNGSQSKCLQHPTQAAGVESGNYCELVVQDNGIGFDEKYSERIFAVFQRLHGREEYEGTGVGLAVCRRIADRHAGTITARSKPGEGSAFSVILPVRQTNLERA